MTNSFLVDRLWKYIYISSCFLNDGDDGGGGGGGDGGDDDDDDF